MIFGGKLFQPLIVLGQKLYLYSSHDVCTGINFIGSAEFLVSFHYSFMFHIRWYIDCCLVM